MADATDPSTPAAAASPGAIAPGVAPADASNTLLKWLCTAQGLVVVGVGAWLLLRPKPTKTNPRRRR